MDINKAHSSKISFFTFVLWLIGMISIGSLYPCAYGHFLFPGNTSLVFMLICVIYIVLNINKVPKLNTAFLRLMGLWAFYFLLRIFVYGEPRSIETSNAIIYSLIFIVFVLTAIGHYNTWRMFLWTQIIMLVLSMVGVGLALAGFQLTLLGDYTINENQRLLNYGFFFMKTHDIEGVDALLYLRPTGYYDEPGSFAFMLFLVLAINKLYFNNRKIELFFLLAGFVTFSLAHVVTAIMYYFLFYSKKRNIKYAVFVFLVLFVLFAVKPSDDTSYASSAWNMIFGRFDSFMSGNDDSRDFNASFEAFKAYFWLGGSQEEIIKAFPKAEVATLWFFMARNGLIGTSLYLIIFFIPMRKLLSTRNIEGLKILFLLLANFFQRPYLHFPIILLAIYLLFYAHFEMHIPIHNNSKREIGKKL